MAQVKEQTDLIDRIDDAVNQWLKQRLPFLHRFVNWHANRMSRVNPRTAWIVGSILFVILVASLFYQP